MNDKQVISEFSNALTKDCSLQITFDNCKAESFDEIPFKKIISGSDVILLFKMYAAKEITSSQAQAIINIIFHKHYNN